MRSRIGRMVLDMPTPAYHTSVYLASSASLVTIRQIAFHYVETEMTSRRVIFGGTMAARIGEMVFGMATPPRR